MPGRGCFPSSVVFLRTQAKLVDLADCLQGDLQRLDKLSEPGLWADELVVDQDRIVLCVRPKSANRTTGAFGESTRIFRLLGPLSGGTTFPNWILGNVA